MSDLSPSERRERIEKLADLIDDIRICMLTTVDTDGTPWSRPMATQEVSFGGDLWFFTRDDSEKVDHIERNRKVDVTFAHPGRQDYVTMAGTALIVKDKQKAEEMWSEPLAAWFPKGVDDPHLRLIKVEVTRAEYWDSPSSPIVYALGYVKAKITGKPATGLGENEKVDLG
ncbi:pyridoxamine 5'-phosphate oxidase family protein [Rubrivirga sp. IMCC45206]|uniref:pyridoxamine 5'-phosphate oxidase family protein n=1 Tax=Rubrivirga sp. IMCC45206 TaxID=3391614 RepID=UPI0039900E88